MKSASTYPSVSAGSDDWYFESLGLGQSSMIFLLLNVIFHVLQMSIFQHPIASLLGDHDGGRSLVFDLNRAIFISLQVGCC